MRTFEKLEAWELARNLAVQVYKNFGKCRDFGFRDQICRSAMSISSNVAEGVERNSPSEFRNFPGSQGIRWRTAQSTHPCKRLGISSRGKFPKLARTVRARIPDAGRSNSFHPERTDLPIGRSYQIRIFVHIHVHFHEKVGTESTLVPAYGYVIP